MKTRISSRGNNCYELLVDEGPNCNDRKVLAGMTLFQGTGCWMLTDIRLHTHRTPSAYSGSLYADDISCNYKPKNEAESKLVQSFLREFTIEEDGSISWSSFEGLVRGHLRPCAWSRTYHNGIGYFTRAEGFAYLRELQKFWLDCDADPAIVKIENPHRQPNVSGIYWKLRLKEHAEGQPVG